jgi:DNA processing protein
MPVPSREERAAVLALVEATEKEWHATATLIDAVGSACAVLRGEWTGLEPYDIELAKTLAARVTPEVLGRQELLIERMEARGVSLITVLDPDYPLNLRKVYNRPPFLFVRGDLTDQDNRAIAVVGTRQASREGLEQAGRLASELARADVTVLSGLARGIDAAAHNSALDAGGRTIAVLGTGILRVYPPEHETLADRVAAHGALVSQFWPDAPPTPYSFPMRNVVTSGMAAGTVVVEASATSGAKQQARLALEHGKRVFLVKSLVLREEWAKRYARLPATTVVESVDDILAVLLPAEKPVQQLALA